MKMFPKCGKRFWYELRQFLLLSNLPFAIPQMLNYATSSDFNRHDWLFFFSIETVFLLVGLLIAINWSRITEEA